MAKGKIEKKKLGGPGADVVGAEPGDTSISVFTNPSLSLST